MINGCFVGQRSQPDSKKNSPKSRLTGVGCGRRCTVLFASDVFYPPDFSRLLRCHSSR